MPFTLHNKVALVTGSSTGLGRAIAMALGQSGATVALNYHNNHERAQAALDEFRARGHQGALFRGDVSDEREVGELVRRVAADLGPIDILVINATPDQPHKPIEDYSWADYQTMLDFFVKSPYLLARACVGPMKARRWGRIINITSEVFPRGVGKFTAYVAAKGGQIGLSRSLATELAPFGITVNHVMPGWIPVERHRNDPAEEKEAYRRLIPAGRWGVPEDVAWAVVYFASDQAGFVTGQSVAVNGGMTVE